MKEVPLANYITGKLIRTLAALCILGMACATASAQLTLDNFTEGAYSKTLKKANSSDTNNAPLGAGSHVGAARQTIFVVGPDKYAQANTLDIGKGICIVDTGFQADSTLQIYYGVNTSGDQVPLGLNLSAYSALQLNFAGLASAEALNVIVEVWPSSGGYYEAETTVFPNANAFTVPLPYSSFNGSGGTLTQSEASDISYILIELEGAGSTESYGITSFQAVN